MSISKIRPELGTGDGKTPCVTGGTAYLMVLSAVEMQQGLVHGKLHDHGAHCAIGSFFEVNTKATVPWSIVDEVAAVNDSVPQLSEPQRKRHVARWLKWKLTEIGMPGFKTKALERTSLPSRGRSNPRKRTTKGATRA